MSLPQIKARYTARAVGAWFIEADSGNYQVAVMCEISNEEFAGERIAWTGTFAAGKATEIALKALREFGWAGDDLSELADADESACAQLLPNSVELSCDMEEYNGEVRLKVKWVNPIGGGRFGTPLAGDKLKAFAALMRGTIRGQGVPRAPVAAQRHPNAPGNKDDVPF